MSKIKVIYNLNGEIKNYMGIKNKNRITFKDESVKSTLILKDNAIDLIRENDEYRLEINVGEKSSCIYFLKNYGKIPMNIDKIYLQIKEGIVELKYKLNGELYELKMNYEVIE